MSRELVRPLAVEIERLGGRVEEVSITRGTHVRLRWVDRQGRDHVIVFPHSSGDRRAFLNCRAQVRQAARGEQPR